MQKLLVPFVLMLASISAHAQFEPLCLFPSATIDANQTQVINQTMASHPHRLAHLLWHATRNGWEQMSIQDRAAIQQLSPLWGQHARVCPPPGTAGTNDNPAGEEFLLMHHKMVSSLNGALLANRLQCTSGWRTFPQANDPVWPVPPGTAEDSSKTAEMGRLIEYWSRVFTYVPYLQSHTLSHIGYLVEFSIHNQAHMRWAAIPRQGDDFYPLGQGLSALALSQPNQFDDPSFNWLGNPYSSQVNPVFWKIHGWIEDVLIPSWLHANGFTTISEQCPPVPQGMRSTCYQWRSQWIGDMPDHTQRAPVGGGMPGHHMPGMGGANPALDQTIARVGAFGSFRNGAADQILAQSLGSHSPVGGGRGPIGGAGPGGAASQEHHEWDDPEAFVAQTGPCRAPAVNIPNFLRQ